MDMDKKEKKVSPLLGQMTIFLIVFIVGSVIVLLLVGKPLEIGVKDFWGNRVQLPLATILLGSASLILFSHFGAKFLTRPILILEEWTRSSAYEIPKEVTDRPDEIGQLARLLFEMRRKLEEERKVIQTDRDIHRALNQMRVITLNQKPSIGTIQKLLSIVIAQADAEAALLIRRDPDGGGFVVVASQLASADEEKKQFRRHNHGRLAP
jgi:HAMP domain-containing protein